MREIERQTEVSIGLLLVVDDDLVQRSIIGRIGAKLGYDTVTASSYEKAIVLLDERTFDIMTLDLSLGERDGVEILRAIADRRLHSLPIVVISGCDERILNSTKRVAEGLGLNLVACLTKPLNLDQLRESLHLQYDARTSGHVDRAIPQLGADAVHHAMSSGEMFVEFQPKVDLQSGCPVGAEVLARWRSPELGVVSPAVFIPRIEELGLMAEFTDYILRKAIKHGRELISEWPGFTIAVNVPGSLMSDLTLPERVESVLSHEGVAPGALIVEVTESVAMSDVDRATDILLRLRLKGIGAAIDDFGTGYSSLAALARLPFSELKIDQSFVRSCDSDPDMKKIVEASIGMAKAFGMKVVAEGIDSPQVLALVRQAGCHLGQGYLFSPALSPDRMRNWMNLRLRKNMVSDAAPVGARTA